MASFVVWFVIIMIFLVFVIGLGVLVWVVSRRMTSVSIEPNAVIVENYCPERSGGFTQGLLLEQFPDENDTSKEVVWFLPRDVPYEKGFPKEVTPKKVIVKRSQLVPLPRGSFSRYRNVLKILPETSLDLPQGFRQTDLGVWYGTATEALNLRDRAIELVKNRDKKIPEIIKELSGGEYSKELIEKVKNLMDNFIITGIKKEETNLNKLIKDEVDKK